MDLTHFATLRLEHWFIPKHVNTIMSVTITALLHGLSVQLGISQPGFNNTSLFISEMSSPVQSPV